jgi:hypothetical protein
MFTVSVNPTYYCNFRCKFCYLTSPQLSDRLTTPLTVIDSRLASVSEQVEITHIDLYGGEIALLPSRYLNTLLPMLEQYSSSINIITNFSAMVPVLFRKGVDLTVSYDFDCREKRRLVFNNMMFSSKPLAVLILASRCILKKNVEEMISELNLCSAIKSVEIKPYSTSQANSQDILYTEYEKFVIKWITSGVPKNFEFINEKLIKGSITKSGSYYKSAFSDSHVYLTPTGKFATLEFDKQDNEYFLEFDCFEEYLEWTDVEKERVSNNLYCSKCDYLGSCLSEHLRDVKDLTYSCNGFKHLLDWYNERF